MSETLIEHRDQLKAEEGLNSWQDHSTFFENELNALLKLLKTPDGRWKFH
jgi:hypothetical protein